MGLIGAVYFGVLTVVVKTAPAQGQTTLTIIPRVAISGKCFLVSISSNACRRRGLYSLASGRGLRGPQMKIVDSQVIFDLTLHSYERPSHRQAMRNLGIDEPSERSAI